MALAKGKNSKTQQSTKTIRPKSAPMVKVRRSKVHGSGVYALRSIKKGTRIIEYLGERVSHAEADRRYAKKGEDDGHTFLFIVDKRTVIDATLGRQRGALHQSQLQSECETVTENRRIFYRSDTQY